MQWLYFNLSLFALTVLGLLQQPCYYGDKPLPISVYNHQMAYFPNLNTIYLFGGIMQTSSDDTPSTSIYKWNMSSSLSSWFEPITTKIPTSQFWSNISNTVTINNSAYFIGIYDGDYTNGKIYVFDAMTETFIKSQNSFASPEYPSVFGCLSTNNSHIFMIGGQSNESINGYIPYLQRYDIQNNIWTTEYVKILNEYNPSASGFGHQYCTHKIPDGNLFVAGGFAGENSECCAQIYDYQWFNIGSGIDGWIYEQNMSLYKMFFGGSSVYDEYNSRVYLIGGKNELNSFLNTIYSINFNAQHLTKTYYLLDAVANAYSLIVDSTRLFVFGGLGYNKTLSKTVQICDINI